MSSPQLLTDDTTGLDLDAAAETHRAAAFRAQHTWHDFPLRWTITTETLYYWLRTPAPRLPEAVLAAFQAAKEAEGTAAHATLQQQAADLFEQHRAAAGPDNSFYRNATIILYLAAHRSKDWQHLTHSRPLFLIAVEEWADEHIHSSELTELARVTNQLIADAESTRAIPRPRGTESLESGN